VSDHALWFGSWTRIGHAVLATCISFVALLMMLRLAGKRSVAKMNIFDFVSIVVIGSTIANTIVGNTVPLAEGLAAVTVLVLIHFATSWLAAHSRRAERLINGDPVLLVRGGRLLRSTMRRERVTEEEVLSAIRMKGLGAVEDVDSVVLETDGTYSVIPQDQAGSDSGLHDVEDEARR
jgi:uncharacterized membrane protein YcaP (DUF421 family)